MVTLGYRIKRLRSSKELSQDLLAESINLIYSTKINKGMISKWENEKEEPRLDYAKTLANYFNVTLDYLLGIGQTGVGPAMKHYRLRENVAISDICSALDIDTTELLAYENDEPVCRSIIEKFEKLSNDNISSLIDDYKFDNGLLDANTNTRVKFNISLDDLKNKSSFGNLLKPLTDRIISPDTPVYPLRIPILGTIRAGSAIPISETYNGYFEIQNEIKADFALNVTDDSMSWAGVHEGDTALLVQRKHPKHGDIVATGKSDRDWTATLKFYILNNGSPLLRAANPSYKDIQMDESWQIVGIVTHIIKRAPNLDEYQSFLKVKSDMDAKWNEAILTALDYGLDPESLKGFIGAMHMMIKSVKK